MTHFDDLPNAVLDGGPWRGMWLPRHKLIENQQAARRMRHSPDTWPGVSLNYQPVQAQVVNLDPKIKPAQVWRWSR